MQSWPNICGIKAEHSLAYFDVKKFYFPYISKYI